MSDALVKGLVGTGLLVQVAAIALGFTAAGWRWPIAAATAVVALGILVVQGIDAPPTDPVTRAVALVAVLALIAAAAHAFTPHPEAAWAARVFFGVEFLFQLALFLFLRLFKMNRLW